MLRLLTVTPDTHFLEHIPGLTGKVRHGLSGVPLARENLTFASRACLNQPQAEAQLVTAKTPENDRDHAVISE